MVSVWQMDCIVGLYEKYLSWTDSNHQFGTNKISHKLSYDDVITTILLYYSNQKIRNGIYYSKKKKNIFLQTEIKLF